MGHTAITNWAIKMYFETVSFVQTVQTVFVFFVNTGAKWTYLYSFFVTDRSESFKEIIFLLLITYFYRDYQFLPFKNVLVYIPIIDI